MQIGKAGTPVSHISEAYPDRVEVRGRDLCCDLMGRLSFTEYFHLLLTGREPTENHYLRMIMNVEYAFDVNELEPLLIEMRNRLEDFRIHRQYLNYPRVHVRFAPKSDATLIGLNADRDTAYVGIYVLGSVRHKRQIPIATEIEEIFLRHGGRPHWGKYRYLTTRSFENSYKGFAAFEAVRRKLDPTEIFSDKHDMYHGLNRFERAPLGAMLRSVFDANVYQQIRLL